MAVNAMTLAHGTASSPSGAPTASARQAVTVTITSATEMGPTGSIGLRAAGRTF